jgi:uncharacterized protein (TIGR02996 family)
MADPLLHEGWRKWRSFVEGLDLSEGSPDVTELHGRLFRLCGNHPLRAAELRTALEKVASVFSPWLDEQQPAPDCPLQRLDQTLERCESSWRALLGLGEVTRGVWSDVQRVALTAGLPWNDPFWTSALHSGNRTFDLLAALRGRNHDESMALLDALLRIHDHPGGAALFEWTRTTTRLRRIDEALHAGDLMRRAYTEGALYPEWLGPLGWRELPGMLADLCENISIHFLARLNEPMPGAVPAKTTARAGRVVYRRKVPDPLPIEPYFQKIPGSEAFLRAISEEPLEDAHRLAFADWLEDAGHEARAQFIRLQCRHDQLPDHPLARRHLTAPIENLFKANGKEWTADLPEPKNIDWNSLDNFRRGLLEHPPCRYSHLHRLFPQQCQAVDVRGVSTPWTEEIFGTNLDRPWLSRWVALEITDYLNGERLHALARSPVFAGLVHLRLSSWTLDYGVVRALAEAVGLPSLATLDIPPSQLGDEGARALAAGKWPSGFRTLKLPGSLGSYRNRSGIGLLGIRALASSPGLANLEHLDVAWNHAAGAGVESLAASPFLANLKTLILEHCTIGNKGAKVLASSPFLKKLTCLDVSWARLLDEGLIALARSPNLANLTVLDLTGNGQIGEAGLRALATSPHLAGLRALSLSGLRFTSESMEAFAAGAFANLEILDLSNARIDGPTAAELVKAPGLNNLVWLNLRQQEKALTPAAKGAIRKRWPFAQM